VLVFIASKSECANSANRSEGRAVRLLAAEQDRIRQIANKMNPTCKVRFDDEASKQELCSAKETPEEIEAARRGRREYIGVLSDRVQAISRKQFPVELDKGRGLPSRLRAIK